MTEQQKKARVEYLYTRSVNELIEYIISLEEEVVEAKQIRARLIKIRNLALDPEERRAPGRPRKDSV